MILLVGKCGKYDITTASNHLRLSSFPLPFVKERVLSMGEWRAGSILLDQDGREVTKGSCDRQPGKFPLCFPQSPASKVGEHGHLAVLPAAAMLIHGEWQSWETGGGKCAT